MRVTRVVAAALFAVASFSAFTGPASAHYDCEEHPHHCYECVTSPCYPEDYPPYLIDKVNDLLQK